MFAVINIILLYKAWVCSIFSSPIMMSKFAWFQSTYRYPSGKSNLQCFYINFILNIWYESMKVMKRKIYIMLHLLQFSQYLIVMLFSLCLFLFISLLYPYFYFNSCDQEHLILVLCHKYSYLHSVLMFVIYFVSIFCTYNHTFIKNW